MVHGGGAVVLEVFLWCAYLGDERWSDGWGGMIRRDTFSKSFIFEWIFLLFGNPANGGRGCGGAAIPAETGLIRHT